MVHKRQRTMLWGCLKLFDLSNELFQFLIAFGGRCDSKLLVTHSCSHSHRRPPGTMMTCPAGSTSPTSPSDTASLTSPSSLRASEQSLTSRSSGTRRAPKASASSPCRAQTRLPGCWSCWTGRWWRGGGWRCGPRPPGLAGARPSGTRGTPTFESTSFAACCKQHLICVKYVLPCVSEGLFWIPYFAEPSRMWGSSRCQPAKEGMKGLMSQMQGKTETGQPQHPVPDPPPRNLATTLTSPALPQEFLTFVAIVRVRAELHLCRHPRHCRLPRGGRAGEGRHPSLRPGAACPGEAREWRGGA